MITPFKDHGRLTRAQRYFNHTVSSERQAVERLFGHVKGRFRRLENIHCKYVSDACYLVSSACVLHNLCVLSNDVIDNLEPELGRVTNYPPVYRNAAEGIRRRDEIVRELERYMQ